MKEKERRRQLAERIREKGAGGRREVALYPELVGEEPVGTGIVEAIETRGVRTGRSFLPWADIKRVERWPLRRCANCLREHGPLQACFLGVLAGVVEEREERKVSAEQLARIEVDVMWDLFGAPAADWLERQLDDMEAADAV